MTRGADTSSGPVSSCTRRSRNLEWTPFYLTTGYVRRLRYFALALAEGGRLLWPLEKCNFYSFSNRTGALRGLCGNAVFRALSAATHRIISRDTIYRAGRLPEHASCCPFVPVGVPLRAPSRFKDLHAFF
jgi:hypothetical protein